MFLFSARSHDTVLFFSDGGKVYALRAYQIPEADRAAKGTFVSNLISIGDNERITAALPVPRDMMLAAAARGSEDEPAAEELVADEAADEAAEDAVGEDAAGADELEVAAVDSAAGAEDASSVESPIPTLQSPAAPPEPCIALCTLNGRIKRVALSQFTSIRSTGLICMTLAEGDSLSYVRLTPGDGELILVTAQGQALRFSEALVRRMGRSASGVRAMRLKRQGDSIAGMEVVEPGAFLLTVTERGYGKRTPLDEYGVKGRGGSGMRTMTGALDLTGLLVAARVVRQTDQVTLISANGTVLRQRVSDIPQTGRATRGSRLINLRDGDAVASVARLAEVTE